MSEKTDIERALKMAEEYAAFAPEKILHTDPEPRNDETFRMLTRLHAKVSFLFPQLSGMESIKLLGLISASEEARASETRQGSKEYASRPEDLRDVHKLRWRQYVESGINNSLLPFQIELIKACFAYRGK